jgi:hypothetical protein
MSTAAGPIDPTARPPQIERPREPGSDGVLGSDPGQPRVSEVYASGEAQFWWSDDF